MTDAQPINPYEAPRSGEDAATPSSPAGGPLRWEPVEALTFAWETLRAHPMVIVVVLVATIVGSVISTLGAIAQALMQASGKEELMVLGLVIYIAGIFLSLPIAFWMQMGQARYALALARGRTPAFGVVFSAANLLSGISAFAITLITSLVLVGVFLGPGFALLLSRHNEELGAVLLFGGLAIVFPIAIWLNVRWSFVAFAAADGVSGGVEILRHSWRLTQGIFWWIVVYGLLMMAVGIAALMIGLLALCIGVIVTIPAAQALGQIALAHAYLKRSGVEPVGLKV